MFAAVILQAHRKKLAVPEAWVQEKNPNHQTKVFFSKNEQKSPDFTLPVKYFLQDSDSVYNAIYLKSFGELKFIYRKKPLNFQHNLLIM